MALTATTSVGVLLVFLGLRGKKGRDGIWEAWNGGVHADSRLHMYDGVMRTFYERSGSIGAGKRFL